MTQTPKQCSCVKDCLVSLSVWSALYWLVLNTHTLLVKCNLQRIQPSHKFTLSLSFSLSPHWCLKTEFIFLLKWQTFRKVILHPGLWLKEEVCSGCFYGTIPPTTALATYGGRRDEKDTGLLFIPLPTLIQDHFCCQLLVSANSEPYKNFLAIYRLYLHRSVNARLQQTVKLALNKTTCYFTILLRIKDNKAFC